MTGYIIDEDFTLNVVEDTESCCPSDSSDLYIDIKEEELTSPIKTEDFKDELPLESSNTCIESTSENSPVIIKSEDIYDEEKVESVLHIEEPELIKQEKVESLLHIEEPELTKQEKVNEVKEEKNEKEKNSNGLYKCKCGYVCRTDIYYRKHLLYHSSQDRGLIKCKYCTYATFSKGSLTLHMARYCLYSKSIKCPHCNFSALRKRNVTLHIKAMHDKGRKKKDNRKKGKYYKCKLCVFLSEDEEELNKHKCEDFERLKKS